MRPIKVSDAPVFVRWLNDKKVTRYLLTQNTPTLPEEKKWIRNIHRSSSNLVWTILDEQGLIIGNTGLRLSPIDKRANFGIMIGEKTAWGNGYAGEVLQMLSRYVFTTLRYTRFELEVSMDNIRAVRAYEKAGFTLEGVRRQYHFNRVTKKLEDDGIMSILRKEWLIKNK